MQELLGFYLAHNEFCNYPDRQGRLRCDESRCQLTGGETLIQALLKNRLLQTVRGGSQASTVYAVTHRDKAGGADIHALVFLTSPALASLKGVNIGALPKRLDVVGGFKNSKMALDQRP